MSLGAGSPWARAPDRGLDSSLLDMAPLGTDEAPAAPTLVSDPTLREKVPSSGYGKALPPPKPKATQPTFEEREAEKATFKPDLSKFHSSRKLRNKAQSSGYGRAVAAKPEHAPVAPPTFRPKTAIGTVGRKLAKSAPSSGYGKVMAVAPSELRPEPERPTFTPEMTDSPTARKLRETAPSRQYGTVAIENRPDPSQRPKTAPVVLRHTLYEDKGRIPPAPEDKDVGPGFTTVGMTLPKNFGPVNVVSETELARQIKAKAMSSGYSTPAYAPPTVPAPEREPEPKFELGTARSTYVDTPEKLGRVTPSSESRKLKEKVVGSGYGSEDFEPYKADLPERPEEPKWNPVAKAVPPPTVEEMPVIKPKAPDNVSSTGYGTVWAPPLGEKYAAPVDPLDITSPAYVPADAVYDPMDTSEVDGDGVEDDGGQTTVLPLNEDGDDIDEY